MTDSDAEEVNKLLQKTLKKLDESEKRQAELEKKISEMESVLTVEDEDEVAKPTEVKHDDSDVHEFVRSIKKEREEKKRMKDERLHIKSDAELDADASKLLERMLHDVSNESD